MNNNYPRYQITSTYAEVSEADWFYAQPEIAVDRGDIYVGFATLSIAQSAKSYLQLKTNGGNIYLLVYTNPTGITGGTVIDQVEQYEAKKSLGVAGEAGNIRVKFKKQTDYVLELTNGDNNTKNYFVKFYMLEI